MQFVDFADNLGFIEGPVWNAEDCSLSLVSISQGKVHFLDRTGKAMHSVSTGGGPNGLVLSNEGLLVAQNGGIFGASGSAVPGVQRVGDNGASYVATDGFTAPNDLAFGSDGRLYVTDPQNERAILEPIAGKVFALDLTSGAIEPVIEDRLCPNGLAFTADGDLLLAQTQARVIERFEFIDDRPVSLGTFCSIRNGRPDGLAIDEEGKLWVCTPGTGGIEVFAADGQFVSRIEVGADSMTTNLCFGGEDGCDLFVTAARWGRVLRGRTDVPGLPLLCGPGIGR